MTMLKPGDLIDCHFQAVVEQVMSNPHGEPSVMVRLNNDRPGLWLHTIPGLIVDRVVQGGVSDPDSRRPSPTVADGNAITDTLIPHNAQNRSGGHLAALVLAEADVRRLKQNLAIHYTQLRHAYRNGYDRAVAESRPVTSLDMSCICPSLVTDCPVHGVGGSSPGVGVRALGGDPVA